MRSVLPGLLVCCCLSIVAGAAVAAPVSTAGDASTNASVIGTEPVSTTDSQGIERLGVGATTVGSGVGPAGSGGRRFRVRRARQDTECFPKDAYEGTAGGYVTVTVNCGGYLLIGGDRQEGATSVTNYIDVLYVPGNGGTFTINTRLLGTNAPSSAVFSGGVVSYAHTYGADSRPTGEFSSLQFRTDEGTEIRTLEDLRDRMNISDPPRPLRPKRYRLITGNETIVLRDDGIAYPLQPRDRSNVKLVQPEIQLEQPTTYIAPQGSASSTDDLGQLRTVWTKRNTVAKGDRIIIGGFSTDGLHGTLGYLTDTGVGKIAPDRTGPKLLEDLVYRPEGVNLTIEQTDAGPNMDPVRLSLDSATEDGLSVVFTPDREAFYLVIDTRKASVFDRTYSPNATFEVTYTIRSTAGERFEFAATDGAPGPFEAVAATDPGKDDQYPYFGVEEEVRTVSTSFTVVEPVIRYTRQTGDGEVIVSNESGETIPGYTTYAPLTDIEIQLISEDEPPPTKITIDDVVIQPDGDFRPRVDLSKLSREYPVEIETFLRERLYDRRPVVLARDPGDPVRFEVVSAPTNVTVTRNRPLSTLTATIANRGVDAGAQFVTLRAGEQLLHNRTLFIRDGRNETIDFGTTRVRLPVGEYKYVVATGDDQASGTLVVQATPTPTPTTTRPPTSTAPPTTAPSTAVSTTAPTPPTSVSTPPTTPPPTKTGTSTPTGTAPGSDTTGSGFLGQSFLGLGLVSVRAAIGGAAVVGGAYVADYWR